MNALRYTLLSLIILLVSHTTYATHIIGGELYYTCTGPNTYDVTLVLYRDCSPIGGGTPFDDPAYLGIYDEDGTLLNTVSMFSPVLSDVPIEVDNPCLIVPPGLCVEQAIYTVSITVPDDLQVFDLVYQRCCRNASIVNIVGPEDTGSTMWQQIPPGEDASCNSSPVFTNYPPSVICVGDPISFDHSATDPDGDSLAYKFFTPYAGASPFDPAPFPPPPPPYDPVTWSAGYDVLYMVDGAPGFEIDVNTGLLTGTATDEGRYVLGVVVEEWRDGVLLGNHIRDFQFNVQLCEPALVSTLGVDGEIVTDVYLDCEDFTIPFSNFSTGADSYLWLFGDGATSEDYEPVHVYGDTGVYTVSLICNPGFVCADTSVVEIHIFNTLTADFEFNAGCSGEAVQFSDASTSTEAGEIISWEWDFGDGGSSTAENPSHDYTIGGIYEVALTVTTDKGCSSTVLLDVPLLSGPTADFSADDVCLNEDALFEDETTHPDGVTLTDWFWDFGDGGTSGDQDPSYSYEEPGTYEVTLIVATNNGCQDTITQSITIGELPYPDAGLDDTVTYLEYYTLMGEGNGTFSWSPAAFVSNPFIANPQIRPDQTYDYILTVTSPDGCSASDTVTIYVEDITIVDVPNAFSPNDDGVNDLFFVYTHTVADFYEFSIYNRWGQQLFTTNDPTFGWDGKYNDEPQDVGAYVYVVRAKDITGDLINLQGSFILVR